MTDKEKILAEIERRISYQKSCINNSYRLSGRAEEEIILEYNNLLSFIYSLPEEPVSKLWHSISELPHARECEYLLVIYKDSTSPCVAGNNTQVSHWDRVEKWCYLTDILKFRED